MSAYWLPPPFWQALFLNLSTTFFALAVAVVAINVYLEKYKQREAVKSLLLLSYEAIGKFHDTFVTLLWTQFSKVEVHDIGRNYVGADGGPNAIKPEDRTKIYKLIKDDAKRIMSLIENLDQSLTELTTLVGWDLDADLLTHVLQARFYVRKFRKLDFDDSEDTKKQVCEYLINLDCFSQFAMNRLLKMAGVKDAD